MEFLKEYIPKETLGDIVALSGMLLQKMDSGIKS